ncbi:MAG: type II/IV secretion system protein [Candidatus Paracaedibacteraceae bacterium]|nr:type II/IV secretion system protein [Candidatus Paracaedibacteraceae bacterium]
MEKNVQQLLLNELIARHLLNQEQAWALQNEIQEGVDLAQHLHKIYKIDPWLIAELESEYNGYMYQRWRMEELDISVAKTIPASILKQFKCLPIQKHDSVLEVVFCENDTLELRGVLKEYYPECIHHNLYYVPNFFWEQAMGTLPKDPTIIVKHLGSLDRWIKGNGNQEDISTDSILQTILTEACVHRASDIHFEPTDGRVQVRLRIDGILKVQRSFAYRYWKYLAARIKVISGMNTAENRRPQAGRFSQIVNGHEIDIRSATHPTTKGEAIVLRLLDKHKMVVPLEELGFCKKSLSLLKKIYAVTQGLVLFTGPTGSGKTTTLYSILNQLNCDDINIMTLEDPVEYELQGIRQTSIHDNVINFKEGIRAILRQDPDVILIGEIRDEDTAKMAFRASQTGHLVFSTLHTNDVWGVFPRLMDLGISFESIKHTVVGLVSQRLVRKRCMCYPKGCDACDGAGLKGRIAIGEMLWITSEMREHMYYEGGVRQIPKTVLEKHYISLEEAAREAENEKLTTLEQIKRYCGET